MPEYVAFIDKPEWLSKEEFNKEYALGASFNAYFSKVIENLAKNIPARKARKIVCRRRDAILRAFPDIKVYWGNIIESAAFDINAGDKEEASKKLDSLTERLESFFKESGVEQKIILRSSIGFKVHEESRVS